MRVAGCCVRGITNAEFRSEEKSGSFNRPVSGKFIYTFSISERTIENKLKIVNHPVSLYDVRAYTLSASRKEKYTAEVYNRACLVNVICFIIFLLLSLKSKEAKSFMQICKIL